MSDRRQRGAENLGCIIGLAILAVVLVLGIKFLPLRIAVAEFEDRCVELAEQASLPRYTDKMIYDLLTIEAQNRHLPLKPEALKVWRSGQEVFIEASYVVQVDLLVTTYDWAVEHKVVRTLF
jgi:hypothetical protein